MEENEVEGEDEEEESGEHVDVGEGKAVKQTVELNEGCRRNK